MFLKRHHDRPEHTMTATARWRALKKTLEAKSGHDFERALFPLLRIRWPDLVHPKSLRYLDNSGIDQVLVVDGGPRLAVVVQCKGFEVLEPLAKSQLAQVTKSVDKFEVSGFRTDEYVLIYNRFGGDQDFERAAQSRLEKLVDSGFASTATVWNLNTLASELSGNLLDFLLRELAHKAARKHEAERRRFRFGVVTIRNVPYSLGSMRLDSGKSPSVQRTGTVIVGDPLDAITADKRSVSLVIGAFGSGKSTLGFRLAAQPNKRVVYIPAAALTHTAIGSPSENSLAQAIVEYLEIFDDAHGLTDEQVQHLAHLAGPLLSYKLRTPDSGLILLVDAIDESRFYSTAKGFQTLTNELARALCPIVITTRLEHFVDSFEAFEGALDTRSPFGVRRVSLLTLHSWYQEQVRQYLWEAIVIAQQQGDAVAVERLSTFRATLDASGFEGLALHHPLFLAMSTDLVAAGDPRIYKDRFELYENWAHEKLSRDFLADRWVPQGFDNIRLLVAALMDLMSVVAARMHGLLSDPPAAVEYIEEEEVRQLAASIFGGPVESVLYTVTAFLDPQRTQAFGNLRLRFFHKSLQDFFAARWLRRQTAELPRQCPPAVREFMASSAVRGA